MKMHWFTLIILVVVVVVYVLIGGAVFMTLEKDSEINMTSIAHATFQSFIDNKTCVTPLELEKFTAAVIAAYDSGIIMTAKESNVSNWSFDSSVFFAVTIITSIGYGHMSPSTSSGQAFFIFYSVVGIPLCATMLIGIGERLSRPYKSLERSRDFTRYHKTEKFVKIVLFTLLYFVLFSIIPATVIMFIEDWTYLEAWYYTIVTLTTVGFGDYVPGKQSLQNREIYKLITEIWIFCGLAWLAMVFHMAVHFVKLVTNKIDAVADHNNGSSMRIPVTSNQVQKPTENDKLLS